MSSRPKTPIVQCKHETQCYYDERGQFRGCLKCLVNGKLNDLFKLAKTLASEGHFAIALQNRANMSENNLNPFEKSAKLTRSPPPTPTPSGTPVKPNNDNVSYLETGGVEGRQGLTNPFQVLIDTDISVIQNDPNLNPGIKSYITQAKEAVATLVAENQKVSHYEKANKQLIEKLQSQVNELQKNREAKSSVPAKKGSGGFNKPQNPQKPQKTRQLKLSFAKMNSSTKRTVGPLKSTRGKFSALEDDAETTEVDDDDTGEEESFNSDPEYKTKRMAVIQKNKRLTKKRKRASASSPENDGATSSRKPAGVANPNNNSSAKDDTAKNKGETVPTSDSVNKKTKRSLPPPPIKVVGVSDYVKLTSILSKSQVEKGCFSSKLISNDVWKVNPNSDEVAKKILETLKNENATDNKVQFYTHANKNLRDIKVICRGLHPTIPEDEILTDLKEKGFKVKKATCLMKKVPVETTSHKKSSTPQESQGAPIPVKASTSSGSSLMETDLVKSNTTVILDNDNQPLFAEDKNFNSKFKLVKIPVHQLDFDYEEDVEQIYKIKSILSMIVKIEQIKVKTDKIVQCKRCQSFGHTFAFCGKQARCVKCAGKHLTSDCPFFKRIINPKCVNCGAVGHPASYRGCPFAKEMQSERKNVINKKKGGKPFISGRFPDLPSSKNKNAEIGNNDNTNKQGQNKGRPSVSFVGASYAKVLSPDKSDSNTDELISQLLKTIESQRKQIEEMNKRMARFESIFFQEYNESD